MNIKALGSSSKGNAYIINDGVTTILIDCGLPIKELKRRSEFKIPSILDGCIISHEHNDHFKAAKDLMKLGVPCHMLKETAYSNNGFKTNVAIDYFLKFMEFNKYFSIGTFTIKPLEMKHDVPCAGFLIYSNHTKERLLYAIDTYYVPYLTKGLNYIMIEANHDVDKLTEDDKANRLYRSHMSIQTAANYLKKCDLSQVEKIYLMHLSESNSNERAFKRCIQKLTGKEVEVFKA